MKSLQEIKDEVAKEGGFTDWGQVLNNALINHGNSFIAIILFDEVAKRYAEEAIKECATRAKTMKSGNGGSWFDAAIDEQSILKIIKELK